MTLKDPNSEGQGIEDEQLYARRIRGSVGFAGGRRSAGWGRCCGLMVRSLVEAIIVW